jgi:hypothetical protein
MLQWRIHQEAPVRIELMNSRFAVLTLLSRTVPTRLPPCCDHPVGDYCETAKQGFPAEEEPFQREIGAIAGQVFTASDGIMDRHAFEKGLRTAEKRAKLPKLDGSLWHAYRRKWATERKHLPLKDVARAGGWKDVNSLLGCQQADDASVLVVTSSTLKPRERAV